MSTQVQINDVPPKTQITATAGQTVFTTNWTANAASDVIVYARSSAQEPDDLTQLVSSTNYTVAFIGGSEIVEVTFLVGLAAGDVVTITRDTPADRLNLYTNTNFTPSMLNQDVGILTLVDQQAQLYNTQVAPHYNVSSTPDLGDQITGAGGDIYLPILGANEAWKKNSSNTAIEAITFPTGGGLAPSDATYILQTPWSPSGELPNQQALSPLATGFMTSVTATGIVSTRTLLGTANQINLTNGTGTGNPVFSLSSSLVLPGTMTFGGNVDADGYNISNIGQANIGNIQISSNSIISTNTNGNINLTPNGTGNLVLDGLNWPQADGTNGQAVTTNGSGQLGWTSFGAPYTASALTSTSDTNVTITLGGNPNTALLQATSITMGWSGLLPISRGGTNTSTLGSAGQLAQSDGTKYAWTTATYPATATATGTILRADGTNWVATTATYPATTTINQILYSSANNVIGEITTANSAAIVTSSTGVPTFTSSMTNGQLVIGSTGATPVVGSITGSGSITVTPGAGTIQISSSAGGTVNPGTANELAYYATTGSAVSGLATANNGVLITSAGGVPSISSTLPTAVQGNITSVGTIGSGTWNGGIIGSAYGGTGVNNGTSTITLGGSLTTSGAFASTFTMTGITTVTFPTSGTLATTSQLPTPSAMTKVDDTNVTLTLGGTPATSLLQAVSLTLGWSGQLGVTRGGTGASSVGANGTLAQSNGSIYTFTTATYPSTTTANQLLYSSATNTVGGLATANSATLVTNASGVPAWTGSMTNGQLLIGSTGATPIPATLTAGPGVSISNGAGSITISGTGSGIGWTEVTGVSQSMAADNGYVSNNAGLVTLTLPTVAAFGTIINVQGKGAGGWKIAQNAGQTIYCGSSASTTGVAGYIASTNRYDSVQLLCITANTEWAMLGGPQGNITIA